MRSLILATLVFSLSGNAHASVGPTGITVAPVSLDVALNVQYVGPVTTFTYQTPVASPGPWPSPFVFYGPTGPTGPNAISVVQHGPNSFSLDTNGSTFTQGGTFGPVTANVTDTGNFEGGFNNSGTVRVHSITPSPIPSPFNLTEGNLIDTQQVGSFFDTVGGTSASDYTAVIDWGDGSATTVGTIIGGGTFIVLGTHLYADEGNYDIKINVTNTPSGATTGLTKTASAFINDADNLIVTSASPLRKAAGQPLGVIASMSDNYLTSVAGDFTVTIHWNDGDEVATVTGSNGHFSINSTRVPPLDSSANREMFLFYNMSYGETNNEPSNFNGFIWVMQPMLPYPQTITAAPGVAFNGIVAQLDDPNSDPFDGYQPPLNEFPPTSTVIDWGDGTATSTATSSAGNGDSGHFSISGSHTFATAGTYHVKVTATTIFGFSVEIDSTAVVATNPITATATNIIAGQGVSSTLPVAHFTINDLASAATDFTANIDWGDGSTAQMGTITGARGEFFVNALKTFSKAGSFVTTITITDTRTGGGSAVAKGTATVGKSLLTAAAPTALTEHAGVPFTWSFFFADANPGAAAANYTITFAWGDGTAASTGTVKAHMGGGFDVNTDHTYAAVGVYTLTVTIADASGTLATFPVTITVVEMAAGGPDMGSGSGSSSGCSMSGGPVAVNLLLLLALAGLAFVLRRRGTLS